MIIAGLGCLLINCHVITSLVDSTRIKVFVPKFAGVAIHLSYLQGLFLNTDVLYSRDTCYYTRAFLAVFGYDTKYIQGNYKVYCDGKLAYCYMAVT